MPRIVLPEILDSLPEDHPDAAHSRRDLVTLNGIMGNHRWFARELAHVVRPGEAVLELGAGTGELGIRLGTEGIRVDALDLCPRPDGWPAASAWHTADMRTFEDFNRYPVVIGNLVLHHLSDAELTALGGRLRETARAILVSEPTRSRLSLALFRWLAPVFGANRVTRHDGRVSIGAGFKNGELPRLLGVSSAAWHVRTTTTLLGAYRMIAVRRT